MTRERTPAHLSGTGFIALPDEAVVRLEEDLLSLIEECKARCGLVLDRTGLILAAAGDFHPISPQIMGATAAGVIAALNTMVARAQSPEVSVRFFGSELEKIHFFLLGDRMILCLILGRYSLSVNVRTAMKNFAGKSAPMLERFRPSRGQAENVRKSVQFIESKLDELFKDSRAAPAIDKDDTR